nr:unnamed protein product [Digitaria exilis]
MAAASGRRKRGGEQPPVVKVKLPGGFWAAGEWRVERCLVVARASRVALGWIVRVCDADGPAAYRTNGGK